ncbi:MAG: translation initiation factor IF-2 N-terminal domain-containing protein, partial [Candidatus Saccharimonadales bacterium]
MITVGTLAERLSIPVTRLIGELMKNGVMATVNER